VTKAQAFLEGAFDGAKGGYPYVPDRKIIHHKSYSPENTHLVKDRDHKSMHAKAQNRDDGGKFLKGSSKFVKAPEVLELLRDLDDE